MEMNLHTLQQKFQHAKYFTRDHLISNVKSNVFFQHYYYHKFLRSNSIYRASD